MLTTTDLVFEDGVESYLSACREIAEKADNLFMFGSARGGGGLSIHCCTNGSLTGRFCMSLTMIS